MPSLVAIREEYNARSRELKRIMDEAGPDVDMGKITLLEGDTTYKVAEIRRRNQELTELINQEKELALVDEIGRKNDTELERRGAPASPLRFPGGGAATPQRPADLVRYIADHPGFKAFRQGHTPSVSIDLPALDWKALVTLTTVSPQNYRQPDLVEMAMEARTVADLMAQGTISVGTVEYYEETTFTSTAAPVAEGGTKPEMTIGYTLRSETARKIAETIPATKESLDDVTWLEGQLRGRLIFAVKRAEEAQLLTGDGTAPNLRGLMNRTGIQTYAKLGTEPNSDAIYRAMQLIRGSAGAGFAEPTAIVMHPSNYTTYQLLRTADGIYINGGPQVEGPPRMWGLPIRQTTAMTANSALVGAFRPYSEVLRREGITVTMSSEHGTFFVENKVMLLAESRLALAVYRPSAFCSVTALN